MSISDNARERARVARLNALESEQRVQNFGEVEDSRVVVINYDPDKKAYLVRTLGGQIGYAMNISGTQLGVGATVQATRKGNGFIIDYFDQGSGKTTNSSDNNLSKNAFNNSNNVASGNFNTGFSPFTGFDPNTSTIGYKPDGQGGCDVKTYPLNTKLPDGVYATAKECHDSQKKGSFKCVDGQGCVEVTDGSGKYRTKAECEAALISAIFTGGQCSVLYRIFADIRYCNTFQNSDPSCANGVGIGVSGQWDFGVFQGPIKSIQVIGKNQPDAILRVIGDNGQVDLFPASGWSQSLKELDYTSITLVRVDGLADNCGEPPKRCSS